MQIIKSERALEVMEGVGVVMRIAAFGVLSVMGPKTPFLAMWVVNTVDAVILTFCAWERGNRAYLLLNSFWLVVGFVGIWNSW